VHVASKVVPPTKEARIVVLETVTLPIEVGEHTTPSAPSEKRGNSAAVPPCETSLLAQKPCPSKSPHANTMIMKSGSPSMTLKSGRISPGHDVPSGNSKMPGPKQPKPEVASTLYVKGNASDVPQSLVTVNVPT
jgi:hypothetical protein